MTFLDFSFVKAKTAKLKTPKIYYTYSDQPFTQLGTSHISGMVLLKGIDIGINTKQESKR